MFSKTLWRVQNRRAMRCQGTVLFLALCSGACTAIQALIVAKIVNRIFFLGQPMASSYNLFIFLVAVILLRGILQWVEEHFALNVAGISTQQMPVWKLLNQHPRPSVKSIGLYG